MKNISKKCNKLKLEGLMKNCIVGHENTNDIDHKLSRLEACVPEAKGYSLEELIENAIKAGEGLLAQKGVFVFKTGTFTGRSPGDRYIVCDQETNDSVDWNKINIKFSEDNFNKLFQKMVDHYRQTGGMQCNNVAVCNHHLYNKNFKIFTTLAWQRIFIKNLFFESRKNDDSEGFTILWGHDFQANPTIDGTRNKNFIILNLTQKKIIIGGTAYSGELKKAVFSTMNYLLPKANSVLPMHCAAALDMKNRITLYFGLSGTGKTTLSLDNCQQLIGDDEHGWSPENEIFNFEAGCYAKALNVTEKDQPHIHKAIRYGAIVENVIINDKRQIDLTNSQISSNIRVTYPLSHIDNHISGSVKGIPKNIFFLSCDAYGVLPPIAKLDSDQAIYYFLSGYTSKIDGTEQGIIEPRPTFSACFGEPFFPLKPVVYAQLLHEKLIQNKEINVWLVNTGWISGGYRVGKRICLDYTRQIIRAVLEEELEQVAFCRDNLFNLMIPERCASLPTDILHPKNGWAEPMAYEKEARCLAEAFIKNFERYHNDVSKEILATGPRV